jgi:hypothetical protein
MVEEVDNEVATAMDEPLIEEPDAIEAMHGILSCVDDTRLERRLQHELSIMEVTQRHAWLRTNFEQVQAERRHRETYDACLQTPPEVGCERGLLIVGSISPRTIMKISFKKCERIQLRLKLTCDGNRGTLRRKPWYGLNKCYVVNRYCEQAKDDVRCLQVAAQGRIDAHHQHVCLNARATFNSTLRNILMVVIVALVLGALETRFSVKNSSCAAPPTGWTVFASFDPIQHLNNAICRVSQFYTVSLLVHY